MEDVYRPLLERLTEREFLPAVLHLSGPLLEWLEAHEPGYLDQLGRLAADGRLELLLAGFYEPILARCRAPTGWSRSIGWRRRCSAGSG